MINSNAAHALPPDDTPRTAAIQAIERRHGADINRSAEIGTFIVVDSFRRPEGLWWVRAVRRSSSEAVQYLVVPCPLYTSLRPGAEIQLTRVTCDGSTYYEAAQA